MMGWKTLLIRGDDVGWAGGVWLVMMNWVGWIDWLVVERGRLIRDRTVARDGWIRWVVYDAQGERVTRNWATLSASSPVLREKKKDRKSVTVH